MISALIKMKGSRGRGFKWYILNRTHVCKCCDTLTLIPPTNPNLSKSAFHDFIKESQPEDGIISVMIWSFSAGIHWPKANHTIKAHNNALNLFTSLCPASIGQLPFAFVVFDLDTLWLKWLQYCSGIQMFLLLNGFQLFPDHLTQNIFIQRRSVLLNVDP